MDTKIVDCVCGSSQRNGKLGDFTANIGGSIELHQIICFSCGRRGPLHSTKEEALESWNSGLDVVSKMINTIKSGIVDYTKDIICNNIGNRKYYTNESRFPVGDYYEACLNKFLACAKKEIKDISIA